jgi:MSHA biogenesis protein MshJ
MNKQWKLLVLKFEALSKRERVIVFVALGLLLLFLGNVFFIEPQLKQQKVLKLKYEQDLLQISSLQIEIAQRTAALRIDPDADIKKRILEAGLRLQSMDEELLGLQKNLVRPERMDALLENILKRNKRLQLISLRSLPVVNLMDVTSASDLPIAGDLKSTAVGAEGLAIIPALSGGIDERSIYKHEVELILHGNYLDMLNYMRELESMPERVYWSKSSLKVIEYPKASLSLHLFTLSLEKKWLNL